MAGPKYDPDLLNRRAAWRAKKRRARMRRFFSFIFGLGALALLVWIFVRSYARPGVPFATPTVQETQIEAYRTLYDALFVTPTGTATASMTPTIPTATITPLPTATATMTLTPTPTPTPRIGTRTPNAATREAELRSGSGESQSAGDEESLNEVVDYDFKVLGQPGAINADVIYPNSNCSWMGVAGIVTDSRGEPMTGYYVRVGGFSDGEERETITGLFEIYGPSGYEITLARPVQAVEGPLWIQLFDEYRTPVSGKTYFEPSERCERSLILINFQKD